MKIELSRSEIELLIVCARSKFFDLCRQESDAIVENRELDAENYHNQHKALSQLESKLNEAEEQTAIHEFNESLHRFSSK